MHPKALLDACSELVRLTLQFNHPADAVVSRFFRDNRNLGPRERATLSETVFKVLRQKLLFEHMARSGSGAKERRLAILGFAGPRDFVKSALNDTEPADLMSQHIHNLPDWLARPLKEQVGNEFEALAKSLQEPGTLDLRVNDLNEKRAEVQKELSAAGIACEPTPFSKCKTKARNCWRCCSMHTAVKWWSTFVQARAEKHWPLVRPCATPVVFMPWTRLRTGWTH
ncbi:MAG: Ribosomal small subunit methyltransferase [Pseudomonadota bacterium]